MTVSGLDVEGRSTDRSCIARDWTDKLVRKRGNVQQEVSSMVTSLHGMPDNPVGTPERYQYTYLKMSLKIGDPLMNGELMGSQLVSPAPAAAQCTLSMRVLCSAAPPAWASGQPSTCAPCCVTYTGTQRPPASRKSPCLALVVDRRGASTCRGAAARGLEVTPRLGVRGDVRALRGAAVSISTGSLRRGAVRVTEALTKDGTSRAQCD